MTSKWVENCGNLIFGAILAHGKSFLLAADESSSIISKSIGIISCSKFTVYINEEMNNIQEKDFKARLQDAKAKEEELEAKKSSKVKRNSIARRAATGAEAAFSLATSAATAATVVAAPLALRKAVKSTKKIGKQFSGLESEIYEKSKIVSKDRIDALGEFLKENSQEEKLGMLKTTIMENWGKSANIAKFVSDLEDGKDVSLDKVERLLDKKPKVRDQIAEQVQEIIDEMPQEKRTELASVLYDGKSRAALQAALVKEALQNRSESLPVKSSTKEQTKNKNKEKGQDRSI